MDVVIAAEDEPNKERTHTKLWEETSLFSWCVRGLLLIKLQ
jgi:hypothetical protein